MMTSFNYTTARRPNINMTVSTPNATISTLFTLVNWYYSSRFWLTFGTAGFLFNILELIVIFKQKKHKEIFGLTLTSLCIADIISSLSLGLVGGLRLLKYSGPKTLRIYGNTELASTWRAGHGAMMFSIGTSFTHMVIIAVQRLFAVFLPLKFMAFFTYNHCALLIIVIWLLTFVYGLIAFFFSHFMLKVSYYMIVIMGLTLIIIYGAITLKTWKDDKKRARLASKAYTTNPTDDSIHRVVFHSLAVTLAFLVCNIPHSVLYLFFTKINVTFVTFYHTVNCLISLNPLLDPLIYFFFHYQFRKYISKRSSRLPHRGQVSPTVRIRMQSMRP